MILHCIEKIPQNWLINYFYSLYLVEVEIYNHTQYDKMYARLKAIST